MAWPRMCPIMSWKTARRAVCPTTRVADGSLPNDASKMTWPVIIAMILAIDPDVHQARAETVAVDVLEALDVRGVRDVARPHR